MLYVVGVKFSPMQNLESQNFFVLHVPFHLKVKLQKQENTIY